VVYGLFDDIIGYVSPYLKEVVPKSQRSKIIHEDNIKPRSSIGKSCQSDTALKMVGDPRLIINELARGVLASPTECFSPRLH
jgi:hypothetical protein